MLIECPSFEDGAKIPLMYLALDGGASPEIAWGAVSPETQSLTLICKDQNGKDCWVVYNIFPDVGGLAESVENEWLERYGMGVAINYWGKKSYGGAHDVESLSFNLYAVNKMLDLEGDVTVNDVLAEMMGNIVEESVYTGIA